MKFRFDPKYTQIAVYAVIVVVISGFLLMSASSLPDLTQVFSTLGSAIAPVIWGVVIAYLLNPGVEFFRTKVFKGWLKKADTPKKQRRVRNVSILITILLAVAIITALMFLIIPQLYESVTGFFTQFNTYADRLMSWISEIFKDQPSVIKAFENPMEQLENLINTYWSDISQAIVTFGSKIGGGVLTILLGLKDFVIGFIIAIYLLLSKEMLKAQSKKTLFSLMKNNSSQAVLRVLRRANDIFIHYITSDLIDSFFVGCVTFIFAVLLGMPYPVFLAVVIGVTNIIPFFGPFIGGIPCAFLVLLVDPMQCLIFAIFLVILQQCDGNIIKPLLFGESMGLPALWVLISIIIGGGLFGFAGMLLAVPVFTIMYALIKEVLEARLEKKGLPSETALYDVESVEKYIDGYEYSEEERTADEARLTKAHGPRKKQPKLLHLPVVEKLHKEDKKENGDTQEKERNDKTK